MLYNTNKGRTKKSKTKLQDQVRGVATNSGLEGEPGSNRDIFCIVIRKCIYIYIYVYWDGGNVSYTSMTL